MRGERFLKSMHDIDKFPPVPADDPGLQYSAPDAARTLARMAALAQSRRDEIVGQASAARAC
jgi:hypothetical protein